MALWQRVLKRGVDIVVSALGLILLAPLIGYVALRVRFSSPGPVIYAQERVGLHGRRFRMLKFRSMVEDAEKSGPMLSAVNDTRITPWGRTMRRWKLDELPQFWNVLKGEMSLVGPRPEREHYIRALDHPGFQRLLSVRPGITSLGMVRFGYAGTLDEIRERMRHDLEYIERASLTLDFEILMRTLKIVWAAKNR